MADDFLKRTMKQKNDEQLRYVLRNPSHFTKQEMSIARDLLAERGINTSSMANNAEEELKKPAKSYHEEAISPRFSLRAVATYQLISSLLILPHFFSIPAGISFADGAVMAAIFLLYLAALISSILIYCKKQLGLYISIFTNLIQALIIHVGGFVFYSTGFMYIFLTIGTNTGFSFGILNTTFRFNIGGATDQWFIGINIIAAVALSLVVEASMYWDKNREFPLHLY